MKNTARNKQIVFFEESRKTVKLKLFLEKAQKGHRGEFLDIQRCRVGFANIINRKIDFLEKCLP